GIRVADRCVLACGAERECAVMSLAIGRSDRRETAGEMPKAPGPAAPATIQTAPATMPAGVVRPHARSGATGSGAFVVVCGWGGLECAPAVHTDEGGQDTRPQAAPPKGETDKAGDAHEPDGRRDQQAAPRSNRKPEQAAKDLAAIERVNRQDV